MGGCFTIVQQGRHATYDGIAALGFSAIQTVLVVSARHAEPTPTRSRRATTVCPIVTWCFHYDDEPADVVDEDMRGYPHASAHAGVGLGDDAAECDRDGRARLRE